MYKNSNQTAVIDKEIAQQNDHSTFRNQPDYWFKKVLDFQEIDESSH